MLYVTVWTYHIDQTTSGPEEFCGMTHTFLTQLYHNLSFFLTSAGRL